MSKWEYTRDIGDIVKTMERFIILLEGDFFISFNAIKSRGGFDGFINFIKDFGQCCGIVFRHMMIRWQDINLSLKNRCYQGRHNYSYEFRFKKLRLVFICLYIIIMIYINNIIKRYDVLL
jgi:cobalt/nickel transport system permease protein